MKTIDLHVHSTASDGTLTPEELIRFSARQNLSAIALTDHDTIDGIKKARTAAAKTTVEFIPGIELSTTYEDREIHLLGLYMDDTAPYLLQQLSELQHIREERNHTMTARLRNEGFDISLEKLQQAFPQGVLTRAHFARYLTDQNYVSSMAQAFKKYLGDGCRCYVPRKKMSPAQAIELIHAGGGLAFFAHPILCNMNYEHLHKFIRTLAADGLDGIEAIYSTYSAREEQKMKEFAVHFNLLISGGSDFHGTNKPSIQLGTGTGNLCIPYTVLAPIKSRLH